MEIGDRIKELRERKNLTQSELAEMLGFKTYTTVSKWESNDNYPKGRDLKKLSEIFNVSSDYLLGLTADNLLTKVVDFIKIPILGTITCGEPILAEENIAGYREEIAENLPNGELFYLQTKGNSMTPTIPENSFVMIKKQSTIENNEIAAVLVNGDSEATLKRVKFQGQTMMLMPDNLDGHMPIIVNEENPARIIGKAVKVSIDL
ncbi:XRE family transcriptional regulator [Vagococcus carniphilus]|uniref:LexA family protein n=1 Tax=Vagococcus carniphilus TaxID=218144 RepID=UPI00288F870C|nr:XRE family transcriptional regulator [Vagococcus carniphilus]MDT2848801.1 XRE family transcriptional regulator [Vagococcus carniphilus]